MAANWTPSFYIALTVHIIVIGSAVLVPEFLPKKPIFPEFVTVDLINVTAPVPPASPPIQKEKQAANITIQRLKPAVPVKTIPTVSDTVPAETVELVKTISIKPLKRKKKMVDSQLAQQQRRAKDARETRNRELQRQQLLAEAKRQKALADAEQQAANEAVQALKQMLLADAAVDNKPTGVPTQRSGSSGSLVENQYLATINSKLMTSWSLPDAKLLNPDLSASVIINISKNGQILNHRFEKRSGDRIFDQFVIRAIQEVNPLPPIPAAMRMSQYSIGLRFRPGSIQ